MKRFLAICAAYLAGAIVGSYGAVIFFHNFVQNLGELLGDLLGPSTILVGVVFAAPVALPLIAVTEYYQWDSPRLIGTAGLALGIVLGFLFVAEPVFSLRMLKVTSASAVAVTLGALTYWFVAWRMLPPAYSSKRAPSEQL